MWRKIEMVLELFHLKESKNTECIKHQKSTVVTFMGRFDN